MVEFHLTGQALWDRMNRAVENVQKRLEKTARLLESIEVPYAIIGGNAVRAWVAQADEAAVRTTRDVDILLRRIDLPRVIEAMEQAGFVYRHSAGIDMFLDSPDGKARDAVHVLFANEKVKDSDLVAAPDVDESVVIEAHRTIALESLVCMKLNVFRDKDRMHLRDMVDVALIDETWVHRYPPALSTRLQQILDDPEG